ncbi:MAG TPA: dihydropteroate synthase, partial [bacterium]|nr:dihydropteroate synthase [bacterium]
MGIVNVTPDSFSDGGRYSSTAQAIEHGLTLAAEGADVLDIGGESSRPGAESVLLDEELKRVVPVIEELRRHTTVAISIDTAKPEV